MCESSEIKTGILDILHNNHYLQGLISMKNSSNQLLIPFNSEKGRSESHIWYEKPQKILYKIYKKTVGSRPHIATGIFC
jgi:hypothetical protein